MIDIMVGLSNCNKNRKTRNTYLNNLLNDIRNNGRID